MKTAHEMPQPFRRMLIANRGEVAVRVIAACADLGIESVAVHSTDEQEARHVREADLAVALGTAGVSAYLDPVSLVRIAVKQDCDAVHPGWGFLSEDPALARECASVGLTLVGPGADVLEIFGDKARARELAIELEIPVLPGKLAPTAVEARNFFERLGDSDAMLVKAVAGGGGRGMGVVRQIDDVDHVWNRCRAEALASFGRGDLYVEEVLAQARHIEVQVLGAADGIAILGDRECSLQRSHQKLIEVAPSPSLNEETRGVLFEYAGRLAVHLSYRGLGTAEFLVGPDQRVAFLEVNPRLQVEHTVTEEVTGLDLVALQIRVAAGATLRELGLPAGGSLRAHGIALQVRVNAETLSVDGTVTPSSGRLEIFEPPNGPGVRVDTAGASGQRVSPAYDTLLAKVVVTRRDHDWRAVLRQAERALSRFRIRGVATNRGLLAAILRHDDVQQDHMSTTFVDTNRSALVVSGEAVIFDDPQAPDVVVERVHVPDGSVAVEAPTVGVVVAVRAQRGASLAKGDPVVVLEAMKMEHIVAAPTSGVLGTVVVSEGDAVDMGDVVAVLEPSDVEVDLTTREEIDLDHVRPDLAAVLERTRLMKDEGRPTAVARRHALGMRTIRENLSDLVDEGSFSEYGAQVLAPQRARRSHDELIRLGPADGIVVGTATINGELFPAPASRAVVLGYDWTVFGGTQGALGHFKTDRMLQLAERWRSPVVFFTEGGGGRPGDTEFMTPAGLDAKSFSIFGRLSGLVPLVGVTSRYSFAGNAAFLGCCDVIIATEGSNIGMGGPAMIEGGGLGVVEPYEVGPVDMQARNGVVDIVVADEAEAVGVARRYLSYFQGRLDSWEVVDQRLLRHLVPENRKQVYDVRRVVEALADTDSVLELRAGFGIGFVTCLARIEGRPVGVLSNNPVHLGGAVDSDAADKAARFMQLCDAFGLPIVMLLDTPGFMVGVEAEETAQVRHFSRMFVTGANLTVPVFGVTVRKGYGLGALASMGGGFEAAGFVVSWPTGEFGGMGVEGHVRLAFGAEIDLIEDEEERQAEFERRVAHVYERGAGMSIAEDFEIDGVIDPADTRGWISRGLASLPPEPVHTEKRRPYVDPW